MSHREFKSHIYPQFARVAQALASEHRVELLDLLAQAPRHVEALAGEAEMPVANVSQHLKVLKAAHLVASEKQGTRTVYRLADDSVARLLVDLRTIAEQVIPEVALITRQFAIVGSSGEATDRHEAVRAAQAGQVFLIDVRPAYEFENGHLPGAVPLPPDELPSRLSELPRDRPIIAYCRGEYCLFADEAVALLRSRGFDAHRLDGGWLEWLAEVG
ncbi:MAG TPA: metalloregulator ArsR/SmtB family transcription factor [Tepidiformaceae bacterium]|nr:metalloregulator ArsR/SmtB family transcription factor [Tepidiformaceae bacterium]